MSDKNTPTVPPALESAAVLAPDPAMALTGTPVRELLRKAPISVAPGTSIRDAAVLMSEHGVSSVLVVNEGRLQGIVTDRDLRRRVLALGRETSAPVLEIATLLPRTVQAQDTAFDVMLLMARHNIHHVPVLDGAAVAGMVTSSDILRQNNGSALVLAAEIYRQPDLAGLVTASGRIRTVQRQLAAARASAYSTGHIVTALTDALTARLLQLAERRLGPPPVPYVWVAAGSQARNEQTAKSDQDNALILDDAYSPALHGEYFESLAREVCAGLDACGFVFCPGEMMAQTDTWRQTESAWNALFAGWTRQPDPTALMLTCVFFDLRGVYSGGGSGDMSLLERVRSRALGSTRGNSLFLAHMVRNALSHTPALGLFRQLSTRRKGPHKGTIDLKMNGVVPIVDLARVYALAAGRPEVNTHDRLECASRSCEISEQDARDLRDALEFLSSTRIAHQAAQTAQGQLPDNHLDPQELSNFDRKQLRDAFVVVQTLQAGLGKRYAL
ncbi:putative nucleotidyltransferase substrate binding domain-containing protein [Amphibiibacter pelophylacis]|uniref:Nucleotidyltransferase substrate binding domain-containing protein n=1 Tax=Amphibiibacter pelophylacis TaxID=1799477 RepID=A0ACC6P1Z5_9BURK